MASDTNGHWAHGCRWWICRTSVVDSKVLSMDV